jgi:hypothetical protein
MKYDYQRHPAVPTGTVTTRGYVVTKDEFKKMCHPMDANVFVFHDKDMKVLGVRAVLSDGTYKEIV